MRPKHDLTEIIQKFKQDFIKDKEPNSYVLRTLGALEKCRTSALGGHLDKCDNCGKTRISYNSCRNRHCPKCQNTYREQWIENITEDLLPVNYFHVVFTLPDKLNILCLSNPVVIYNLLFKAAWNTISDFAYNNHNLEAGMIAALHTWGQNLSLHPHLHCIIPSGGIDYKNNWKFIGNLKNNFLFPVKQLSIVFRGKFLSYLKKENLQIPENLFGDLYKHNWVVYSKSLMSNPNDVVNYLGRYSHKIAISNHRILSVTNNDVCFNYKDYKDNDKIKKMSLSGVEFLRRFAMHILPKRFVRIRHFGFLSSAKKYLLHEIQIEMGVMPKQKNKKQRKDWKQICRDRLKYDPDVCPYCKTGNMITIEIFNPLRAPPEIYLQKITETVL